MIRVALLCVLVAMSYCQSPNTSTTYSPNNNNSCASTDSGNNDNSCKSVNTIIRPTTQLFAEQPLLIFLLLNTPVFKYLDNSCFTFFPLAGNPGVFMVYNSLVYTDGSSDVNTYIIKSFEAGANKWAGPQLGYVNYNLGYIGCGTYLRYSCPTYGNAVTNSFLAFGPGNGTVKLSDECVQNAKNLAKYNGLDLGDYYLLPYNLPTRCVYRQICLPTSSSLSCQQGNTCKAYNSSSAN